VSKHQPQTQKSSQNTGNKRRWLKWGGIAVVLLALFNVAAIATGAQLENHDPFCASCHTEPETTYVDRTTATPVDLASAHAHKGITCINCHSGEGLAGRANAMMLGARDTVMFVTGNYPQPTVQTRPILDENCLKCHADVPVDESFDNHFHNFLPKWQKMTADTASCVDCHQSHATNGDSSIAFLNEQTAAQVCNKCHTYVGEN